MVITALAELVQWELASLRHSCGTAVSQNRNSNYYLSSPGGFIYDKVREVTLDKGTT